VKANNNDDSARDEKVNIGNVNLTANGDENVSQSESFQYYIFFPYFMLC
jgi:hypothetical protein